MSRLFMGRPNIDTLTELIERNHLIMKTDETGPRVYEDIVEFLRRADLSFEDAKGWIVEGKVGKVTIRPNCVGNQDLKIYPNPYRSFLRRLYSPVATRNTRKEFLNDHGFSMGELLTVEEESVEHTESGTSVTYRVPLKKRKGVDFLLTNVYSLTVQTFYEPIKT